MILRLQRVSKNWKRIKIEPHIQKHQMRWAEAYIITKAGAVYYFIHNKNIERYNKRFKLE